MRRKAIIIATLAALLTAAFAGRSPVYGRAVSAMHGVQKVFADLKKADSMTTIERFVFSLVLSNSKAPAAGATSHAPDAGRM